LKILKIKPLRIIGIFLVVVGLIVLVARLVTPCASNITSALNGVETGIDDYTEFSKNVKD
jgi:hypothetical protein